MATKKTKRTAADDTRDRVRFLSGRIGFLAGALPDGGHASTVRVAIAALQTVSSLKGITQHLIDGRLDLAVRVLDDVTASLERTITAEATRLGYPGPGKARAGRRKARARK